MISDREWSTIKVELKKNFERILVAEVGLLQMPFEDLVDIFRSVLERELGDSDLDDRQEVIKAIKIRYKSKSVDDYGTAAAMLALKLESFFKRVYKIVHESLWVGESDMLKGQIVTFLRNFKFTYADPQFANADITVFEKPNKEFIKTDVDNNPLFAPDYFKGKFPFGKQFKIAYDLRNREGHLDPDTDDDQNSILIREILVVYFFVTYKYADRLKKVVIHAPQLDNVSNWSMFSTLCNSFNRRHAYFLIVDPLPSNVLVASLANLKWDFVFDFDSHSEVNGVLKDIIPVSNQAIYQIIHHLDDRSRLPSFPDNTTFWYFPKGNNQVRKSLLSQNTYAEWRSMYVKSQPSGVLSNIFL